MPFGLLVWAHKTNDSDWSDASYTRLYEINTVEQFWGCVKVMQDFMEELMFFVMLNDAVPRWEHESNRHGGYFSRKQMHETGIRESPLQNGVWEPNAERRFHAGRYKHIIERQVRDLESVDANVLCN